MKPLSMFTFFLCASAAFSFAQNDFGGAKWGMTEAQVKALHRDKKWDCEDEKNVRTCSYGGDYFNAKAGFVYQFTEEKLDAITLMTMLSEDKLLDKGANYDKFAALEKDFRAKYGIPAKEERKNSAKGKTEREAMEACKFTAKLKWLAGDTQVSLALTCMMKMPMLLVHYTRAPDAVSPAPDAKP